MLDLLEGVRVIDLTTVVLGPYATRMLGDLGADVVKVEPPEGDLYRAAAPSRNPGMGASFLNLNTNKRSVCLNLKNESGRDALRRLVKGADIFVHNMRPAAASRLDIGYEQLATLNPQLIYCNGVGFGSGGSYAGRPAYDDIVQAESGMAWLAKDVNGEPRFVPTVMADKISALFAVQGMLSGLVNRQRTGKGTAVEIPMFECMANFLLAEHISELAFDPVSGKAGYERLLNAFHRPYRTSDDYIVLLPYSTSHWKSALELLRREDLATAEWVCDDAIRSQRIAELYQVLAENLPRRTTVEWLEAFSARDIPCSPVNSLDELVGNEHLQEVNFVPRSVHPTEGSVSVPKYPLTFEHTVESSDRPAPNLGEQAVEVLMESGLSHEEATRVVNEQ